MCLLRCAVCSPAGQCDTLVARLVPDSPPIWPGRAQVGQVVGNEQVAGAVDAAAAKLQQSPDEVKAGVAGVLGKLG